MAKPKLLNIRGYAAQLLVTVLEQNRSLNFALSETLPNIADKDRGLLQQLSYGVLRWKPTLTSLAAQLIKKPFKTKDQDIFCLLLIGIYQLRSMRTPAHAAISETVNAAKQLGKPWAAGLLNACLRNYQRNKDAFEEISSMQASAHYAHPQWLLEKYQQDWPDNWEKIVEANNQQPPMMLRANTLKTTVNAYLSLLTQHDIEAVSLPNVSSAIKLTSPTDVYALPNFVDGWASVQDGSAQLASLIMDIQPKQRILDACAAPGGKTCHLLELEPDNELVAIDIDPKRLEQIKQNTDRLGLQAELIAVDAAETEQWWDGRQFDRILLDAPCTGSGVIRRHPDIKVLRRQEDVALLAEKQQQLLEKLWPLLKPDGLLVYTTCSVFKQENELQIADFLHRHPEARERPCTPTPASKRPYGYQRLPGDDDMDGFFYACLQRV